MNKSKYVFAQLVEFLDYDQFRHIVDKYKGNHYAKHFTCWNQLLTLMFGQLSNRESLRDLIIAIEAHYQKCYHLGFGKHVTRSNLAKANTNRDYRIFEEYAYYLVSEARRKRATDIYRAESFFVVRAKTNLQYKCIRWRRRLPKGILTDAEIELTVYGSQKGYPEHLRDLFDKTIFKNDKDRSGSGEPNLFNF